MATFLILACMMLCAALGFLLPSLAKRPRAVPAAGRDAAADVVALYRQQMTEIDSDISSGLLAAEHQQQARGELGRRMLDEVAEQGSTPAMAWRQSWKTALVVFMLVPVVAVLMYARLGNRHWLESSPHAASEPQAGAHALSADQISIMVERLAQKLDADPDNAEGWAMLARSYEVLGRYADAIGAFKQAAALVPEDAALLADYADALAMTQQGRLDGKPMALVRRALKADPQNLKALALAGTDAFDRRDYRGAAAFWARAIRAAPADAQFAMALHANFEEANTLAAAQPQAGQRATAPTANDAAKISGRVTLSAALRDQIPADAVVFVFARAETGPRMPLAIMRANVQALPLDFILDDQSAMSPELKLSRFKRVIVTARVSRSGSATAQPGDLVGSSVPVAPGTRDLRIEIGETLR